MPAPPPLASNFAEGLVMISTLAIASAGIWSSVIVVGLPSTNICGVALRKLTLPSISTFTEGTFFITSTAVPPTLVRFFSTLKILRSMLIVSRGLLATTVTFCNCCASVSSLILPRSLSTPLSMLLKSPFLAPDIFISKATFCSIVLKPMAVILSLKEPMMGRFSRLNSPFLLVSIPPITTSFLFFVAVSNLFCTSCTDTASMGLLVAASITLPYT